MEIQKGETIAVVGENGSGKSTLVKLLLGLYEPSSALDPLSEIWMYRELEEMVRDKTAIIVTHRLGSVKFADKIAVMKQGKLLGFGLLYSHQQDCRKKHLLFKNRIGAIFYTTYFQKTTTYENSMYISEKIYIMNL